MNNRTSLRGALLACALIAGAPALAQTATPAPDKPHGFWITTSTPELKAAAGNSISIPLSVINDTDIPKRAKLTLSGLPDGWSFTLKHGATEVGATMVAPNDTGSLTLELKAPAKTMAKTYPLDLKADYSNGSTDLPLAITIADVPSADPELKPELPALRGGVNTDFQYKLTLKNRGVEDALFTLGAKMPDGFQATFKKGYGTEEITGVPVKAGGSETVSMHVKLDRSVAAGDYPIQVAATADGKTASATLGLRVTGSPSLLLTGPQERLSGTAVAGKETTFPFTVANTGSAPARNVKLNASSPQSWKVTFEPAELPQLAPGTKQTVNVSVKPAEKAIAGDYMVTVRTQADGTSESEKFRITVNTSTVWGMVGLGVIGAALLVLALAVSRYGRR